MHRRLLGIAVLFIGIFAFQARGEEAYLLESYPLRSPATGWYQGPFSDDVDFGLSQGKFECTYDDYICTINRRRWKTLTEEVILMNARFIGDVQFQLSLVHDHHVFKTNRRVEYVGIHIHCRPLSNQLECSIAASEPNKNFYVGNPPMPARRFLTIAGHELRGKFEFRFKRVQRANDAVIEMKVKFADREIGSFVYPAAKDYLNLDYEMGMIAYTDGPTTSKLVIDKFGAQAQLDKVPFFAYYDPRSDSRQYISDFAQHFQYSTNPSLRPEGIGFHGFRSPQPGMGALYRLRNPNTGNKYFTIDTNERNVLVRAGWIQEAIDGYLYPAGSRRGKIISRLYNKYSGAHLFTENRGHAEIIPASYPGIWFEHAFLGEGPF